MKKLIAIVLSVLMLVSFVGCGVGSQKDSSQETPSTDDTSSQGKPDEASSEKAINLTLSIWGSDAHKALYEEMFEEYRQTHPNVSVEVIVVPFGEYQQKLAIMIAGKEAPDIAWMSDRMIPQFLQANQLVDISPLKADADYDFDDINPGSLELLTKDGVPHGVAFSSPPQVLFYNKTMFEAKGLETPTELAAKGEWTFDKFRETAIALSDPSTGTYGVRLGDNWQGWMDSTYFMAAGYGGDVFDADGNFVYSSPEAQQGIQMYMDMIFADKSHPMPGDQVTFDSGNLGMFKSPVSYGGTAKNITDFEYDIAPLPKGPASSFVESGFAGYVMFSGSDPALEEARFDLYKFITSKESMLKTSAYFVPSRKSILESEAYKEISPLPNKQSIQTVIIDQMPEFRTYPAHVNWTAIDAEMQVIFDEMYIQSIDVPTAAKEMEERVANLA